MTEKTHFEKPLKLMRINLLLSGIKMSKVQWNPILDIVVFKLLYYLNIIVLYYAIFGELYWLVDGIQSGGDFVEMCLTVPCTTISIQTTLKTIPLYFKSDLLDHILSTLKEIHPEQIIKKSNVKSSKRELESTKVERDEVQKQKINELANDSAKLLKVVGVMLVSITAAVLAAFLLAPLVFMYYDYYTKGEWNVNYPFKVKYSFSVYEVKYWPLIYIEQVWATLIVCQNILGTENLFYTLCTYIEMHFRILCIELEGIQSGPSTQEVLLAAVKKHQLLIHLVEQTEELFTQPLLFHFVSSSFLICLSAFNITVAKEMSSVFAFATFLLLSFSQVSLLCYFGDKLMRSSTEVSGAIYNCPWYDFNQLEKKAVLFMIIRSQKPCKLTASKFVDVNLRAFTTILSRSWSYFALLKTVYN